MSEEPNAVATEVQDALDVHEPSLSKVPGSAPKGEEDEGEESDDYDEDAEDEGNKDGGEYVDGEDDEDDDGEEGADYENEGGAGKKSNLTALLLDDPNAVGGAGNADEGEYDVEADDDEDGEYAEEPELDDEESEVVAVQANGNSKKRTIDDVNSEELGVEAEERDGTKKLKA